MNSNYSDKLRDPRWQKKRLEVMQRDDFTCMNKGCFSKTKTLNVHHLAYSGNPWDIDNEYLMTLCEDCHKTESLERKQKEQQLLDVLRKKKVLTDDLDWLIEHLNSQEDLPFHIYCLWEDFRKKPIKKQNG